MTITWLKWEIKSNLSKLLGGGQPVTFGINTRLAGRHISYLSSRSKFPLA